MINDPRCHIDGDGRARRPGLARGRAAFATPVARGFSLVELMVAMTIGLLIIVGLTAMYVSSSSGKKTDARFAEFQTNGRYAIDTIRRDIQQAGFAGFSVFPADPTAIKNIKIEDNCAGDAMAIKFDRPIFGYNDATGLPSNCLSGYQANSDVIVLRRAGPECVGTAPCSSSLSSSKLYMRSGFGSSALIKGDQAGSIPVGPVPPEDYELHTDIYYVRDCASGCTQGTPGVPTLYRKSLGSGPAMTDTAIAANIEDLQLQYGVLGADGKTTYYNAVTGAVPDWTAVTSIRVWLLARSSDKDPGFTGTQTFEYADRKARTFKDGYQRQVFQQLIQVRESKDGVVKSL